MGIDDTNDTTVAVLGLGRMGRAMAERLTASGIEVTCWSRSGGSVAGAQEAPTCDAAVADADVVILALYDASACRETLDRCLAATSPDCVVVNTVTVSPEQALDLERRTTTAGRAYLHCPVLGSVPAVRTGSLALLAGGAALSEGAASLLSALGEIAVCHDAPTAAAMKLLANSVLAGSTLLLGEALAQARRLGLDDESAFDLLERTTLGRLVSAKRASLTGAESRADFTAGALRKDVRLLADTDTVSAELAKMLSAADVGDEDDFAKISATLGNPVAERVDPESNLGAMSWVVRDSALLEPLVNYARGHATGSPQYFDAAFRSGAHIEGIRDREFTSWSLEAYRENFPGHPADDEESRSRTITDLRRSGTVATATMVLEHGSARFTDLFLLVEEHGTWRIANKVYHRETVGHGTSPAATASSDIG